MKCPVCSCEVPRGVIRRGSFACPQCKEPLRIPEISGMKAIPLSLCGLLLAFLIPYLMGLQGNRLLFATIILLAPVGLAVGALAGAVGAYFSPWLERDPGGDDGEILHIVTPPRGPWKGQQ